jgi:hypothetical protein
MMNPQSAVQEAKGAATLRVLNPVAARKFRPIPPARRHPDLAGKKIGLYWNYKKHGDVALGRVRELLSERYAGMSFEWLETGPVNEASEEWFEGVRASGVEGVVAATGD